MKGRAAKPCAPLATLHTLGDLFVPFRMQQIYRNLHPSTRQRQHAHAALADPAAGRELSVVSGARATPCAVTVAVACSLPLRSGAPA